ncbi:MAG: thioredoxin domain-containing protein [Acidobacteria bacterium]|jgi:protein-disulfide isomerase|nr:thioredoxin domain-containing protein [Acidobacteriota bacterium]
MSDASSALRFAIAAFTLIAIAQGENRAQEQGEKRCPVLQASFKATLAARVRARYQSDPAATVQLIDDSLVSGTCYHRLIFEVQSGQRVYALPLYLTPDLRFLTRDLTDIRADGLSAAEAAAPRPVGPREMAPATLSDGASAAAGPPEAPVTLVVFSDFQCAYCKRFAEWLKAETARFKTNQLRVVYRHFPLSSIHPWAQAAAEAAACAAVQSPAAFWKLHDSIFADQASINPGNVKDKLQDYAQSTTGLDLPAYEGCVETGQALEAVRKDQRLGASAQVRGTPTVFLNGKPLPVLQSAAQLHAAIEEALQAAKGAAIMNTQGAPEKSEKPRASSNSSPDGGAR